MSQQAATFVYAKKVYEKHKQNIFKSFTLINNKTDTNGYYIIK